jgi:hypothetical protein
MWFVAKLDFVVECVHLDDNILQHTFQMNNVTLVGIIEEELENVTTIFLNTYNKTHDKLKTNLKWKCVWYLLRIQAQLVRFH